MPTEQILTLLISERDKLNRAIEALGAPVKRRGRPPNAAQAPTPVAPVPRKRTLSAAGRRAIVAATKKRWALIKAGKTAKAAVAAPATSVTKRQPMTAARKKALSVKMKAAWAKRRKVAT